MGGVLGGAHDSASNILLLFPLILLFGESLWTTS